MYRFLKTNIPELNSINESYNNGTMSEEEYSKKISEFIKNINLTEDSDKYFEMRDKLFSDDEEEEDNYEFKGEND